jgi:hypothetical protein
MITKEGLVPYLYKKGTKTLTCGPSYLYEVIRLLLNKLVLIKLVITQIVAWENPNPNHKGVTTMGVFIHCHLR